MNKYKVTFPNGDYYQCSGDMPVHSHSSLRNGEPYVCMLDGLMAKVGVGNQHNNMLRSDLLYSIYYAGDWVQIVKCELVENLETIEAKFAVKVKLYGVESGGEWGSAWLRSMLVQCIGRIETKSFDVEVTKLP